MSVRVTVLGDSAGITLLSRAGCEVRPNVPPAGPELFRQDELVRQFLNATGDARTAITDPRALYYGIAVNDQSLTPGANPRLGPTRFADWLSQSRG